MRTDFLDFPTAWDIQNEVGRDLPHDDLCSSVYSTAFLCDCGAVPNEWERRCRLLDQPSQSDATRYPKLSTGEGSS
jgi:hypothetical protein